MSPALRLFGAVVSACLHRWLIPDWLDVPQVYDVTDRQSFDNIRNWIKNIKQHASETVRKILLGNKCDMDEKRVRLPVFCPLAAATPTRCCCCFLSYASPPLFRPHAWTRKNRKRRAGQGRAGAGDGCAALDDLCRGFQPCDVQNVTTESQ